jgi:hypothetical protein
MVVSPRQREIIGLECSEVNVFLNILIKTTLEKPCFKHLYVGHVHTAMSVNTVLFIVAYIHIMSICLAVPNNCQTNGQISVQLSMNCILYIHTSNLLSVIILSWWLNAS